MTGSGEIAVESVFAAFGIDAEYVPQSGPSVNVRVVSKHKDEVVGFDMTRIHLAEKANLDHAYVTKYVRMTQLAPDIVQSILDGRQPQTLTLSQLLRTFPDMWPEQRQHFGYGAN